jgi:hypothetical protein
MSRLLCLSAVSESDGGVIELRDGVGGEVAWVSGGRRMSRRPEGVDDGPGR